MTAPLPEVRSATRACLASFAGGVLLNADRLPLWCAVLALAAAVWRASFDPRPVARLAGRVVRIGLALIAVAGVLLEFRTLNGIAAGTALLAVMGALKLFEMGARRDRLIVVAVSLVLLLAACLDRQDLLRLPFYVAELFLACVALALAATPRPGLRAPQAARLVARGLLGALPLALFLFVFFPRIAGSFWALPNGGASLTGLGDEMSPGDIDQLTESDEPAFRVRFAGTPPPLGLRYWRGPVMHEFDGRTWRRAQAQYYRHLPLEYAGTAYSYRITLEPQKRNWLFALDRPAPPHDPSVSLTFDDQLVTGQTIGEPTSFELTSYPQARATSELPKLLRTLDTRCVRCGNPRARALGEALRARAASDTAFVAAALDVFRQGFEYTLTPPRLEQDAVDQFLFDTKRGFCGHYASAFVTLMRAGGVPAHVVTGYLGGEWNPLGGYFIIRQSDAHAWAEVWLEGRGWTRIDPTAVVAPERLTEPMFEFMPQSLSAGQRLVHASAWAARLRLAWDATDNWWRDQMQHYDFRRQMALLERLGVEAPSTRTLTLGVTVTLALWLIGVGWASRGWLGRKRRDPLARAYDRLCRKLARVALERAPHEGPISYADRVATARPDLAARVRKLCGDYATLRFGLTASGAELQRLTDAFGRAVRAFRPERAPTRA